MQVIEPAAPLLPQSGQMVMLDRVIAYGDDWLQAEADLQTDHILAEDGALPSWVMIEVMAQGIAALAGVRARLAGEPVRMGFLLGTRQFRASVSALALPAQVQITVTESLLDANGFAVYDCTLHDSDKLLLAQAAINVYSPANIEEMMTGENA